MKNLLITGGTGFFGRSILRYLQSEMSLKGYIPFDQVTLLSRFPEIFQLKYPSIASLPWLKMIKGDVLQYSTLPHNLNYQYIIHAATDSTQTVPITPLQTYRQIVEGTENLLNFAVQNNTKRFLFTSSGGAYGPQPPEMEKIFENYYAMPDPLNSSNAYGVAKRVAEHLCAQFRTEYGLEIVIARCFAFVGQDLPQNAHFAIGNFIRDALIKDEILVKGNGTPLRSYMYQSDLATWILKILTQGFSGHAYNVGSDEAVSIAELALLVKDIIAPHKKIIIQNMNNADNAGRNTYIPDITKAKLDLNLSINVDLKEAIKLTALNY